VPKNKKRLWKNQWKKGCPFFFNRATLFLQFLYPYILTSRIAGFAKPINTKRICEEVSRSRSTEKVQGGLFKKWLDIR